MLRELATRGSKFGVALPIGWVGENLGFWEGSREQLWGARGESLGEGRTDGESPGRAEVQRAFRDLARAENLCRAEEGDDAEM